MVLSIFLAGALIASTAGVSAAPLPLGVPMMVGTVAMSGVNAKTGSDQDGNSDQYTDQSNRAVTAPVVNNQMYSFQRRSSGLESELVRRQINAWLEPRGVFEHTGPMALTMLNQAGIPDVKLPQKRSIFGESDDGDNGQLARRAPLSLNMGGDANGNSVTSYDQSDRSVTAPIVNNQQYSFVNAHVPSAAGAPSPLGWTRRGVTDSDVDLERRLLGPMSFSQGSDANGNQNTAYDQSYRAVQAGVMNNQQYSFGRRDLGSGDAGVGLERRLMGSTSLSSGSDGDWNTNTFYDQSYRPVQAGVVNNQQYSFGRRQFDSEGDADVGLERRLMGSMGFSSGSDANYNQNTAYDQSYRAVAAPTYNNQVYSFGRRQDAPAELQRRLMGSTSFSTASDANGNANTYTDASYRPVSAGAVNSQVYSFGRRMFRFGGGAGAASEVAPRPPSTMSTTQKLAVGGLAAGGGYMAYEAWKDHNGANAPAPPPPAPASGSTGTSTGTNSGASTSTSSSAPASTSTGSTSTGSYGSGTTSGGGASAYGY